MQLRANGSEVIDCTAYNGRLALIRVFVDGNGVLGLTMMCKIDTGAQYYLNSAGNHINARVFHNGGRIYIAESFWGTDDKISTSFLDVFIMN